MTEAAPILGAAVLRGLNKRCPRCGEGRLFRAYLKVHARCATCDLEFGRYPADDGPAYLTIALVGHLVVAPLLIFPIFWRQPALILPILLPVLALVTLVTLSRVKGGWIGADLRARPAGPRRPRLPGQSHNGHRAMNAITLPARPSGLEQLHAIFASPDQRTGISRTLGFAPVEIEEGRVVFEGHPDETVYNPIGTAHGGYLATLLDSAVGCAVHSVLQPGQGYTTLELKVTYLRAVTKDTGPVRAEGQVIRAGRRAAFAEGRLTDAEGRLYATATSTLLVFDA
jgi:uncharacterized protein (TIGR00369 family)